MPPWSCPRTTARHAADATRRLGQDFTGSWQVIVIDNSRRGHAGQAAPPGPEDLAWLALHAVDLAAGTDRRARWVRLAAVNWGRLVASVQLRIRYL